MPVNLTKDSHTYVVAMAFNEVDRDDREMALREEYGRVELNYGYREYSFSPVLIRRDKY